MTRSFRLTRRAENSLADIAEWTIRTFGIRQAELYETELIDRCEAITRNEAVSQSCAVLLPEAEDIRFARAGEHFIVFLETETEVIIVDFLHSRSDLPRHLEALNAAWDGPN